MQRRLVQLGLMAVLIALVAVSCRTDTELAIATPTVEATEVVPATAAPTDGPEPTSTTVEQPTPLPTAGPDPTPLATSMPDLPGDPWDLWVPIRGEFVAVVGVAHDDILEVHEAPGENTQLVGTLAPLANDIVSTGEGRSLPNSIWWRITQGDIDGWVGSRFMSRLGTTNDITSQIVDDLGSLPAAETMADLGQIVANTRTSEDPPSRIVVSVAPTVGDLGEITIDVVGLGDDAVEGERLHIFGAPLESGEGFSLKTVEATAMCSRGVTEDLFCL